MSSDIVERLRTYADETEGDDLIYKAADEIERLRALVSAKDSDAVLEEIAFNLTDQRDEPDMWLVSYERVQYWRDKAIKGAEAIRNLKASGDNA